MQIECALYNFRTGAANMKERYVQAAVVNAVLMLVVFAGVSLAQDSTTATTSRQTSAQSSELANFFAQYFEERLRDEPEFATSVGRHEYDDRWSDLSPQGREQRRSHLRQRLEQLSKFPAE